MTPMEEVASFRNVPVLVEAELGRLLMTVREILGLDRGSLIEISRAAGENIDVRVGGRLIGFGEIVLTENSAAVRITDFRSDE